MRNGSLFSLLSLPLCIFADGQVAAAKKVVGNAQQAQASEMKPKQANVVLTSARPECDNGWYLFADALYWHASVGSTDYAFKQDQNPAIAFHPHKVHSLNFKWAWGFRAGLGWNMDHDMWDTNLYYTWFHTHNSNAAWIDPPSRILDIIGSSMVLQSSRISWNIHFSMFDWELGRWHYVSEQLALRPHIGIKGGWINQTVKQHDIRVFSNPTPGLDIDTFKNNFWGVGPSFGVNTLWVLGSAGTRTQHRFSLFGDCGGALMYGHFRAKHVEKTFNDPTGVFAGGFTIRGLNRNLAVAMLQGQFGFSWDTDFNQNRNHFTFRLGYELQYWFRQNQLFKTTLHFDDSGTRLSDDLALQGITADFRFDF